MKAELMAEDLRSKLKQDWPILNHCSDLEVLHDPILQISKPARKIGYFERFKNFITKFLRGLYGK